MDPKEREIADLRSKLEVLEHENQMLAERSEDMTLMSMISEISNEFKDHKKILVSILERISMLKDIMICACGTLDGEILKPIATFWQLDDELKEHEIIFDEMLVGSLNEGSVYLDGDEVQQVTFCDEIRSMEYPIREIVIFTFIYRHQTPAVFLFADNSREEERKLERLIPLLQQVTYLAEDRINNLYLLDELQKVRISLEKRVTERTAELEQINKELKEEIGRRTAAEIEMKLSEEKFREIFNHANDAIILWEADENGMPVRCLEVNEVFLMMTGYMENEVLKMNPDRLRGFENDDLKQARMDADNGRDRRRFEVTLKTKSGQEIPTEVNARNFKLRDREVVLAVHRDISERKQFETRILREKERAEESDRLKSVFLANMSHEIRTPMNAIVGFSELLYQEDLPDEERHDYLDILQAKSQDLLTLINDILFLSKMEADQVNIHAEPTDLDEYLRMSEITWRQMISKSNNSRLTVSFNFEDTIGKIVKMDEVRVSQVMNNLISNAIKFTEQGEILISCVAGKKDIEFRVKDSGIGIPSQKTALVFERFRQADEGQSRRFGGSGLGLAICKQLTELMGGEISVESSEGKGSEFSFTIPLEISGFKKERKQKKYLQPGKLTRDAEILIVEDEITNYEFLEAALKIHNLKIHHASTAEDAIELFRKNPGIRLVLMDLHLPGMSGVEATAILKKINMNVPIIGQTAVSPEEVQMMENSQLLDDYIYKPINTELLFSKLSKFLNS